MLMSNYTLHLIFGREKTDCLRKVVVRWFGLLSTFHLAWWENSAGGMISAASKQASNMGISCQLAVV